MSFVGSNILAGASGQGDASYQIERSLRFNSEDDSSLSKSFSTATNRKKFTFACWVKQTTESENNIFVAGSGSENSIRFNANGTLQIKACGGSVTSTAQFRDPSAWYHILVVVNSAEATQGDRIKLYVNGVLTALTGTGATLNGEASFNSATSHYIGRQVHNTSNDLDGYLTDVQFIDGQALAATDFGEFDENGVWQAKEYQGSYITGVAESTGAKPIHNTTDNFGQVKGTGTRTDSNSSYLVLALPMDGSNQGTTISDESANIKGSGTAKTVTNSGVTTSTSSSQFYGSSGDFTATSAQLTIGSSSDFAFGTGDFTIEWWMNMSSFTGSPWDSGAVNTSGNLGIFIDSTYMYVRASATDVYFAWNTTGVSTGEWHHYALVRDNGTMSIYIDGVSVSSGTNSASISAQTAYVGYLQGHGYANDGYMQDLRVYKGLAKYTSDFTVPPKASNSFYLKFADNSSNAALGTDSSGNNSTWTVNNLTANAIDYVSSTTGSLYSGSWDQAFNGSTSTPAPYIYNTTSSVTLSTSISGVIEIYTSLPGTYAGNPTVYTLSNGATYSKSTTSAEWISFGNQTNVTSISVNAPDPGTYIFAIRVDGTILVTTASKHQDSVIDVPTDYTATPNNGGNYCTLNPLSNVSQSLKNGNLETSGVTGRCTGTIYVSSGKYYWEVEAGSTYTMAGIESTDNTYTAYPGGSAEQYALYGDGNLYHNGSVTTYTAFNAGDILGFLLDMDAGELRIRINNTAINSGNAVATGLTGKSWTANCRSGSGAYDGDSVFNFGQRAYKYTLPTGYKSLCTTNLPDPTIEDGTTAVDVVTWSGDGSGARTVSGLNLKSAPDFIWSKTRNHGYHNNLWDSLRGFGSSAIALITDYLGTANGGKLTSTTASSLSFDGGVWHNENGRSYVAWAWDGGDLTTTSSSSYNQTRTWSDNAVGGRADEPIEDLFDGQVSTFAQNSSGNTNPNNLIVNFSPGLAYTSSVEVYPYNASSVAINNGSQNSTTNQQWNTVVSGSGTLTKLDFQRNHTNGCAVSAIRVDGKILINPGVIPAGSLNSSLYDQSQNWTSQVTGTAYSSSYAISLAFSGTTTNNGAIPADNNELVFTPSPSFSNATTVKIIYYYPSTDANAMKLNGTAVGSSVQQTSGKLEHTFDVTGSGFTSFSWSRNKYGSEDVGIYGIEVDGKLLVDSTVSVDSVPTIGSTATVNPSAGFAISKATMPGSGDPTIAHGLGAKPDLLIFKSTTSNENWYISHKGLTNQSTKFLRWDGAGETENANWFASTEPTSNVVTIRVGGGISANHGIIIYSWSEVEGYSKFGSYLGNGSADGPFVYTGFKPAIVWVKYAAASGSAQWFVYDSARDIDNQVSNSLNPGSANAEATSYPIDFLANGFKIRTADSSGYNNYSNAKYVFCAWAENPFKTSRAR